MTYDVTPRLYITCFTLVSRCWWTLACALPLVLSFSYWSVAVGGLWLVLSHSSCLFSHWSVAVFHTGQLLLVDFDVCASTRLVFLTLVSCYWWTLTCALPLVLSFSHWSVTVGGLWLVRSHSSIVMKVCKLEVCYTAHTF